MKNMVLLLQGEALKGNILKDRVPGYGDSESSSFKAKILASGRKDNVYLKQPLGNVSCVSQGMITTNYALTALRRLFSLCFKRAARLLWCNPFDAALSMVETAALYAFAASSALFSVTFFRNFLIAERSAERWLMLCMRRLALCRARFLACGEFAKVFPLRLGSIRWTREYGQFMTKSQV